MSYKPFPNDQQCERAAEAVGRLYAESIAQPWPMPPLSYGPGRQPAQRAVYYQRFWQEPKPAWRLTDPVPPSGGANVPPRIEVDPFTASTNGRQVDVEAHGGGRVTLDFTGLVATPAGALAAEGGR